MLPRDVVVALAVAALHRPAPQNFFTVTTVEQATYTRLTPMSNICEKGWWILPGSNPRVYALKVEQLKEPVFPANVRLVWRWLSVATSL